MKDMKMKFSFGKFKIK